MVGLKEENKYCGVEQKSARWAHNPEVGGANPPARYHLDF